MSPRTTHPAAPDAAGSGADRSWAARMAGLQADKAARRAILAAILAPMGALLAWVAVLLPGHGDIRFQPRFWLLAAPLAGWSWAVQSGKRWAIQSVGLMLLAAPSLSLAALLAARYWRDPLAESASLATPLAMAIILAGTVLAALLGGWALRRSSLPGGTRAPVFRPPGTVPPGQVVLPASAQLALRIGSLALSGALINGMLFGIVSMIDTAVPDGGNPFDEPLWLLAIPAVPIAATGWLMLRGSFLLRRDWARGMPLLGAGLRVGAAAAVLFVVLLLAWPTVAAEKIGMGMFMLPMALAAVWGARKARRLLTEGQRGA